MSEYARRNLACSSWRYCPEGWRSWAGNVTGFTFRPFCDNDAGHAGDHQTTIETIEHFPGMVLLHGTGELLNGPKHEVMRWPNTLGIPDWLEATTKHGIEKMREHGWTTEEILA